jgi:SpoVK/Ycf46/Vps4 family AAA+-type ATPase
MACPFGGALPSDISDACDQHRVAPYLLRYYASVSNPRASALADGIFETLVGQISWPRGSLRRATAAVKAHGHPATGELPEFLRENESDEDQVDLRVVPTNDVDAKLSQHVDFKTGLKALYADDPTWLRDVLRNSLRAAEARQDLADGPMLTRLQQVGEVFGWKPAELQLARIAMHASDIAELAEWLDTLPMAGRDAARAYKRVLSADVPTLRQSLRPNSHLSCCGLFIVDRPHDRPLGLSEPPRLHPKLMAALGEADFHVKQLSRFLFSNSPAPTLSDADFVHLRAEYEPLTTLLRQAASDQEAGINILIYGPPGTGKTEFARWLVSNAHLSSFEVPAIDGDNEDGCTHPVGDRLALLRSAHWLMRGAKQTALIFDEAEDAFPKDTPLWINVHGLRGSSQGPRKAWVNQLLELTPLPTIWISNAVNQMDPAYLRRFTYHLEMRSPTQRIRERIAQQRATAHGLPEGVASGLGEFADASPAMIDSALRFARLASKDDNPEIRAISQGQHALRSLRAGLQAAGLKVHGQTRLQITTYDPSFINLRGGMDTTSLLQSLHGARASNLCFYGVPGTGKTSFAEHIARELDRPLMIRRASDLQSMWLGETEKRMRESFAEAQSENAVLLLDEADSFLGDRSGAHHSWERSQVNELLQCMERFEGIFIAATNMIDTLDKAALRRFTYKIEFLPLNLEQRVAMFRQQLGDVQLPEIRWAHLRTKLARLDGLTAGDYAVIARQASMRTDAMMPDEMIAVLEAELQLRSPMRGRAIGFA